MRCDTMQYDAGSFLQSTYYNPARGKTDDPRQAPAYPIIPYPTLASWLGHSPNSDSGSHPVVKRNALEQARQSRVTGWTLFDSP